MSEQTKDQDPEVSKNILYPSIELALSACYREVVGYVQKKGRNTAQNYNFANEQTFLDHIRPALVKYFITIAPVKVEIVANETIKVPKFDRDGKPAGERTDRRVLGIWTYRFSRGDSHLEITGLGEGIDSGDKASYKAATGAYKYALRQAFMIATGDDPEIAREDEEEPQKPQEPYYKSKEDQFHSVPRFVPVNDKAHETQKYNLKSDRKEVGDFPDWTQVVVHFGYSKGKALGDLEEKNLKYLYDWSFTKEQDLKFPPKEADLKLIQAIRTGCEELGLVQTESKDSGESDRFTELDEKEDLPF